MAQPLRDTRTTVVSVESIDQHVTVSLDVRDVHFQDGRAESHVIFKTALEYEIASSEHSDHHPMLPDGTRVLYIPTKTNRAAAAHRTLIMSTTKSDVSAQITVALSSTPRHRSSISRLMRLGNRLRSHEREHENLSVVVSTRVFQRREDGAGNCGGGGGEDLYVQHTKQVVPLHRCTTILCVVASKVASFVHNIKRYRHRLTHTHAWRWTRGRNKTSVSRKTILSDWTRAGVALLFCIMIARILVFTVEMTVTWIIQMYRHEQQQQQESLSLWIDEKISGEAESLMQFQDVLQ